MEPEGLSPTTMRLHLLTAVTRPDNLPAIEESISVAMDRARTVDVQWHCLTDLKRQHVGGQASQEPDAGRDR